MSFDKIKAKHAGGGTLTAKELGELADCYSAFRESRLLADKAAAALKVDESAALSLLIEEMRKQEINGAGGKKTTVTMNPAKDKPHVKDWSKVYAYILETKDFSLLQKRIGEAAIAERWDDGKVIPGVEKFPVYTLSVSSVK